MRVPFYKADEDLITSCSGRQAIFYLKSWRWIGFVLTSAVYVAINVAEPYGYRLGYLFIWALWAIVIYLTPAPSKSPEWKRLE